MAESQSSRLRTFRPADRVTALASDAEGWLWVGTDVGLCRFDGRVCVFQEAGPGTSHEIRALGAGSSGELVVGGAWPAGLWRRAVGLDSVHPLPAPRAPVRALIHDPAGQLWVGTEAGLERRGARPSRFGVAQGLPDDDIHALWAGGSGRIWVGTESGLGYVEPNGTARTIWRGDTIHALSEDPGGKVIAATEHQGLLIFDPASGTLLSTRATWLDRGLDPTVLALHRTPGGTLWVGTGNGLVRLDATGNTHVLRRDDAGYALVLRGDELPAVRVSAITSDRESNLWLGTDGGGLVQLRPPTVAQPLPQPLGKNEVAFALAADQAGDVWLNLGTQLARVRGSQVDRFVPPEHFQAFALRSMVAATGGGLWVAGQDLFRVRDGIFARVALPGLPAGHHARSLYQAKDGALWLGLAPAGLAELRDGGVKFVSGAALGCAAPVSRMLHDAHGNLYVATDGAGLCMLAPDGSARRVAGEEPHRMTHLMAMTAGSDGALWLGTRSAGLIHFADGRFRVLGREQGLSVDAIGEVIFDAAGFLWLTSRTGVQRFSVAELTRVAAGQQARASGLTFGVHDGLPSNDCLWGWSHPALRDGAGRLWVSTLKGVAVFDRPDKIGFPSLARPRIDRVLVNGQAIKSDAPGELARQPLGRGNLEFHYAIAAFAERSRVRYRYRLNGFDTDWVEAQDRESAYYTNLDPGRYRFTAQAFYQGDGTPPVETSVMVALVPPFHRTSLFYGLCTALALLGLGLALRLRTWQRRARAESLTTERTRIARDIHDTLEQTFVATKFQIEAAQRNLNQPESAGPQLARARELLTQAMAETRVAIWSLRATDPGGADLSTAVAVAAGEAVQGSGVSCTVTSTGGAFRLTPEAHGHVLRVVRGSIANVLKHAQARTIEVAMVFAREGLTVQVRDDGMGTDESALKIAGESGHWGLIGMHERAAQLGGTVTLNARADGGTELTLHIPRTNVAGSPA